MSATPEVVNIPAADYAALVANKARLDAIQSEQSANDVRLRVERGEAAQVIADHQRQLSAAREQTGRLAIQAELAKALSNHALAPYSGDQLTQILSSQLTATPNADGSYTVVTKDFRTPADFVKATLERPDYSHFRADRTAPAPAAPPAPPKPEPRNLGEAYVMGNVNPFGRSRPANATSDERTDMSRPMGMPGAIRPKR